MLVNRRFHTRPVLSALALFGGLLSLHRAAEAAPTDAPIPAAAVASADSVQALFERAGALYARQQYGQAIPLFEQVLSLDPRHGNAYALLGGAYFQLGEYPKAISAFERALELDEGIKLAYLGLVAANYLTDRVESASQWVRRLVPILTGEERARYLATISSQFPLIDLGS